MGVQIKIGNQASVWDFEVEPLLIIDPNFNVLFLNQKAREKYRYTGSLPVRCFQLTHNLDHPCFEEGEKCPLKEVLEKRQGLTCVHKYSRPGEKILYEKILASPVYDLSGKLGGIVEIIVDITPYVEEEIRVREELERREKELESLLEVLEASKVGIFILDSSFKIVWLNQAIEKFFGIKREEVIGKDKKELIQQKIKFIYEKPEEFAEKVLKTYKENTYIENFECHVLPGEGRKERWLEHFSQPIESGLYAGGRVEYYIDVTHRKRLEKEFLQAQRFEPIAQMIAGIAHDFNNLLMTIQGFAELSLIKLDKDHPVSKNMQHIISSCERGAKIIDKLLTFMRKKPIEIKEINLTSLVKGIIPLIKITMGPHIKTRIELPEKPLVIRGNESEIEQVLLNLVMNARDAMPEGGDLWIRLKSDGQYAFIEVEDSGVGIPSDILPKIFEPFFTTKGDLGSGLGLSVVYGVVKSLGGDIEVQSQPGKGTLFRISFPLAAELN
ncbi:hybrid sensor histidine kinase/response regulator [Thermosulfurimonas dismutans]|uniref:histidine kinase n=1 Tax=Thermosulfurimonas dismutans TaxID=999894 RepID=A0A179D4A8_9BACT|nr:PAS domain-containing sensor histidine kinase [Thermosulfurimonas dismutans]OAQ20458.1 sensory box histidine kinase/response regulator [Thermosulfurimonas dismutans]